MRIVDNLKNFSFKKLLLRIKSTSLFLWSNIVFLAVLFVYVVRGLLKFLIRLKLIGKFFVLVKFELVINWLTKLMYKIDKNEDGGVTKAYLIELAFRNMKAKKNRSIVTIGGVALGVGSIVFLVSIGYGLEALVIGRVAKLDELKMADVSLGKSLSVKLNDETMDKIRNIKDVSEVIPVVSMVSKITYNNSVFDVMSFGVDERYIKAVNPNFLTGEKFADKDKNFVYVNEKQESVLGVNQEVEKVSEDMKVGGGIFDFNVEEDKKVMVYDDCNMIESEALGYVIRSEGGYVGEERWGEFYLSQTNNVIGKKDESGEKYTKWIRGKVPLWMVSEEGMAIPKLDRKGDQEWVVGCIKNEGIVIDDEKDEMVGLDEYLQGDVLGEATASASLMTAEEATASSNLFETVTSTDASGIEWVELKKIEEDPNALKEVSFSGTPVAEAFVSTGMLKLLGMSADKAIGTKFKISYIIPDGNISGVSGRLQSQGVEYRVAGVVDDATSNYYYFQIADAKRLGISVYSQLKVVAKDKTVLAEVRKTIEGLGLKTDSTADTVVRIESLFGTLRVILGFLGMIALAVASLGMFNTMTVSLLERTREVGVMKTMGMLSNEVRELFLAESMIMGVGGGVLGIMFGFTLGRVVSLILTSISVLKGQGAINIATIPWFFTVFILGVSFFVGIITGWYPSKRARQISALNALRYE